MCGGRFCGTASRCHRPRGDHWGLCGRGSALASGPGLTRGHVSSDCFTAEGTSYWAEGGEKGHGLSGSLSAPTELWSFRNPPPGLHLVPGAGVAALQSPSLCNHSKRGSGKVGGRGWQATSQPTGEGRTGRPARGRQGQAGDLSVSGLIDPPLGAPLGSWLPPGPGQLGGSVTMSWGFLLGRKLFWGKKRAPPTGELPPCTSGLAPFVVGWSGSVPRPDAHTF